MQVIANNCVATIQVPKKAKSGSKVAYNPIVNLFVTMGDGISAWNPVTGKVIKITDFGFDGDLDMTLVPGNRVALSYSELYNTQVVEIYSLEKLTRNFKKAKRVFNLKEIDFYPGKIALSPEKSLLLTYSIYSGFDDDIWNIFIDWDELKVFKVSNIKDKLLTSSETECFVGIFCLCCTPDYQVVELIDKTSSGYAVRFGKKCTTPINDQRNIETDEIESHKAEESRGYTDDDDDDDDQYDNRTESTNSNDDDSDDDDSHDDSNQSSGGRENILHNSTDDDDDSDGTKIFNSSDEDDDMLENSGDDEQQKIKGSCVDNDKKQNNDDDDDTNDNEILNNSGVSGSENDDINHSTVYQKRNSDNNSHGDNGDDENDNGSNKETTNIHFGDSDDKSDNDDSNKDDGGYGENDDKEGISSINHSESDHSDSSSSDDYDNNDDHCNDKEISGIDYNDSDDDNSDNSSTQDDDDDDNHSNNGNSETDFDDSDDKLSDDDYCCNKENVEDGLDMYIKRKILKYCILDGIEYKLNVSNFVHDGQNLILADTDKILLLETLANGSNAHVIVSGRNPELGVGLGINHKGQLMVCEGENTIKIFEYRSIPRSLQDLCRCCILEAIPNNYSDNVKKLFLPEIMKDYLLYRDKGY